MPKYLAALDLGKNELRNARVQNLATAPGTPAVGQIYFDTVTGNLYFYDGSVWRATYNDTSSPNGPAGGSLTGTYPNPTIAPSAIVDSMIAAGAAIQLSKLAVNPLARANHTGTQTASTISDFDTQVRTSRLDQLAAPTAPVSLNSQRITNLADPSSAQDAATKAYVDATAQGLDIKLSVRYASTSNISLNNGPTAVDGVTVVDGDRVLVKNQTTASQNGLYIASTSGAWTRATDANSSAKVTPGLFTFIEEGTTQGDSGWVLTTDAPITLGTTGLVFTQFTGTGQINAGAGLTKTGNTLDVVGTTDRIIANADTIDIASTYAGQTSITTLGTVTTGTWQGDPIAITKGGTGATTPMQARLNLGTVGKYATTNGGTLTDTIVHNLNTSDVHVRLRQVSDGLFVEADVAVSDANTVTINYSNAPTAGALRIVVIG